MWCWDVLLPLLGVLMAVQTPGLVSTARVWVIYALELVGEEIEASW